MPEVMSEPQSFEDFESYGLRAALSIWCRLVLFRPGQRALLGRFVLFCVVLCVPVR
jgi:hypothetical protein